MPAIRSARLPQGTWSSHRPGIPHRPEVPGTDTRVGDGNSLRGAWASFAEALNLATLPRQRGACYGRPTTWRWETDGDDMPVERFFDFDLRADNDKIRLAETQQVCYGCPIRRACAEHRLPNDEGVWGGELHKRKR